MNTKKNLFILVFIFLFLHSSQAQINSTVNLKNAEAKNIILIGECKTPGTARAVTVKGLYAYLIDGSEGLRIISLENPFNPKEVSSIKFSQSAFDVKVKANLAFVSVDQGLRIVNIRNPYNPTLISSLDIKGYADGLDLKDNFVYLTDAPGNLKTIDVSNPYHPVEIGNYSNLVFPSDVEVKGNYAYIADENSIQVIDISNPSNPRFADKFNTFAYYLDIRENYLYLADYHHYLKIFDITNPTQLNFVSQFKTPSWTADVSASYQFAYVADSPAGMRTIDISNPNFPKEVGYYDNESIRANGITSIGRIIFVAGGDKLYILVNTVIPWSLAKNTSELEILIFNKLQNHSVVTKFTLSQNYPNPFNPSTTIKYTIPTPLNSPFAKGGNTGESVTLKVYNILGKEVTTLVNKQQSAGTYQVIFDAKNLPSGTYFYRLKAGNFSKTKQMILIK